MRVSVVTFLNVGAVAFVEVQVTNPLQVLAPAGIIHPLPETVAVAVTAAQLVPFQLEPDAQVPVNVTVPNSDDPSLTAKVFAPFKSTVVTLEPLALFEKLVSVVRLCTFGDNVLEVFQVNEPLQLLAPAGIEHPVPDMPPEGRPKAIPH